jgi:molybdate transport system permease protein
MNSEDWIAILLTVKLAGASTAILLLIGPAIAWWLSGKASPTKSIVEALVALPLVLPPTVLGFYLLLAFSPENPFGSAMKSLTGNQLSFHFSGLLIASVLYSFPFVVQPLQAAFTTFDRRYLEISSLMGMGGIEQFFRIILPLTLPSFISATLLAFAHTVGEFGVVLVIGGNIAGETRVLSIALFDHVETLNYQAAHRLALVLLAFSLLTLMLVYALLGKKSKGIQCA